MNYGKWRKLNIYKEAGTIIYSAVVSEVVKFVVARRNLKPEIIYLKRRHRYKEVNILNTQSTLSQIRIWSNKDLRPGIRQTFSGTWKVMKALLNTRK